MKNKKLCFLFFLILTITFTSCSLNKDKETSEKDFSSTEKIIYSKNSKKEKKPLGEPYTVGVTPDDYNMDYDTSRLKSLNEKKSKYYPEEGVKGIYLNAYTAANPKAFKKIMNLLDETKLNAVVLDVKDDWGNITCKFDTNNKDIKYATHEILDAEDFINKMHKKGIYVIGRITTFKDSVITELAANAGFDEIQFDYIRFAEGFETFHGKLDYPKGRWEKSKMDEGDKRIDAITSFVKEAREMLQAYDTPCGIDVFGYSMQVGRADGIGQDFKEMSNQADVMSSMIYPSHWGLNSCDIEKPDLEPYELVKRYLKEEQEVFSEIEHKPQSRPWIQDFTASWIGAGNYMEYDKEAVEDQIKAIYDSGQKEFLLWNASGDYTRGVNY